MRDANPARSDEPGARGTRVRDAAVLTGAAPEGPAPTVPFHSFILKIHSRCDLACDYCYMYEGADQSWRGQPRTMSPAVLDRTAARIAEHATTHGLSAVKVVLHGGEPLLMGPAGLGRAVRALRRALDAVPVERVDIAVQTNGLGLDERYLALFAELDVRVGVSLDGDAAGHDRHRRRANGRGSHTEVAAALRRLTEGPHRHLFGGLLCVIDPRNDPLATYRHLLGYAPPVIDFLLPHGNWSQPPPGRLPGSPATPYADWLAAVFDVWFDAPVRETRIRLLDDLVALLLGGRAETEGLGLAPVGYAVVETDGAIGRDATLRTTYPGAITTGLHVLRDPFDRALHPAGSRPPPGAPAPAAVPGPGLAGLSATCRACPLHRVCGGGHVTHRYRADGTHFANPSVYCPDLASLIAHVGRRLTQDLGRLLARPAPAPTGAA
ncbi:FxsB family cyclophane-forming radical SAM/SPASM peptide maturase [Streptomyces sp. NPDC127068]|uniref:FxsB family cyclophane-forming radical SAM/SPASM peptide maturase n=1 Tax=Streptomyces sp. NPDC127068 TaxID=3347127 RepID=UPI00364777E9